MQNGQRKQKYKKKKRGTLKSKNENKKTFKQTKGRKRRNDPNSKKQYNQENGIYCTYSKKKKKVG